MTKTQLRTVATPASRIMSRIGQPFDEPLIIECIPSSWPLRSGCADAKALQFIEERSRSASITAGVLARQSRTTFN